MSSGIIKPIDRVFSTKGTEWHGLAEAVETITEETVRPITPKIIRGGMVLDMGSHGTTDELRKAVSSLLKTENLKPSQSPTEFATKVMGAVRSTVRMPNHQGLVADYRECFPELVNSPETSGGLVPLHVPKNSYVPIENGTVFREMQRALQGVDASITCVGTLEAGKKFFVSARLGDGGEFEVNGDKFLANLNFITSHDGTLAVEAYDSTVRIVCINTLRWSREAAGDVGFKVYHSGGAELAMANLGDLINRILSGRADFRNQMEYLASVAITLECAQALVAGYFARLTEVDQLAGKAFNAVDSIAALFRNGKGNKGKSLYDLLNGATEHWTSGDGTGKEASATDKAYAANFGEACDHKTRFCNLLMAKEDVREELIELGKAVLAKGKKPTKAGRPKVSIANKLWSDY